MTPLETELISALEKVSLLITGPMLSETLDVLAKAKGERNMSEFQRTDEARKAGAE